MTLDRSQKIEAIRAKCMWANPEIELRRCDECDQDWSMFDECPDCQLKTRKTGKARRTICLADVLLLLREVDAMGDFRKAWEDITYRWDLRRDSLDELDNVSVDFLHSLLS